MLTGFTATLKIYIFLVKKGNKFLIIYPQKNQFILQTLNDNVVYGESTKET